MSDTLQESSPTYAVEKSVELRARKNAKITPEVVESIASLVVEQLNETEACKIVGISPERWRIWKCRHKNDETYSNALTRLRANFIKGRMNTIKAAEKKDWRAADRLLQMVAPERFSPNHQGAQTLILAVPEGNLASALKRIYGQTPDKPKQLDSQGSIEV